MAAIAAAVLASLSPVGSVAETLKKPVRGPKLVCFKYSSFDLLAGETMTDLEASVEGERLTVRSPSGAYDIGESEIFGGRGISEAPLANVGGLVVYRAIDDGHPAYGMKGVTSYSNGRPVLIDWLTGPALKGDERDRAIYSRFHLGHDRPCGYMFTYSWF